MGSCRLERTGPEIAGDGAANERVVAAQGVPGGGHHGDVVPAAVPGQIDDALRRHRRVAQQGRRRGRGLVPWDRVGQALPGEAEGGQRVPRVAGPRRLAEQSLVLEIRKPRLGFGDEHAGQHAVEAGPEVVRRSLHCLVQRGDAAVAVVGIGGRGGRQPDRQPIESPPPLVDGRLPEPGHEFPGIERASDVADGGEGCEPKLCEGVGGDRGVGMLQPRGEPLQAVACGLVHRRCRGHVSDDRLVGLHGVEPQPVVAADAEQQGRALDARGHGGRHRLGRGIPWYLIEPAAERRGHSESLPHQPA